MNQLSIIRIKNDNPGMQQRNQPQPSDHAGLEDCLTGFLRHESCQLLSPLLPVFCAQVHVNTDTKHNRSNHRSEYVHIYITGTTIVVTHYRSNGITVKFHPNRPDKAHHDCKNCSLVVVWWVLNSFVDVQAR